MSLLDKAEKRAERIREVLNYHETVSFSGVGKWRQTIISISDIHIPMQRMDLLKEIIRRESGADILIVNGDLFDAESISSFYRHKEVPLIMEYLIAQDILKELSDNFGKVVLIDGNHDASRYRRQLEKTSPAVRFLFRESLLSHLASGVRVNRKGERIDNEDLSNVFYAGDITKGSSGWWHKEGKVLFAHRLRGNVKAPMGNSIKMMDYFRNRGTDFECLVTGHTHQGGLIIHNQKILIDQGSLCLPMKYEGDGSCNFGSPVLGYAKISLDRDGSVDLEKTRFVPFGTYRIK